MPDTNSEPPRSSYGDIDLDNVKENIEESSSINTTPHGLKAPGGTRYVTSDGRIVYAFVNGADSERFGVPATDYMKYGVDQDGNVVYLPSITNVESEDSNEDEDQYGTNDDAGLKKDAVASKMQKLKNVLTKLNTKFNYSRPVYTQYLYFEVNDTILVDTTQKEDGWITNNLVSFTLEQNGSGQANTFTLQILFVQNDRNIQSIKSIDAALLTASRIIKDDTGKTLKDNAEYFMDCKFKYGYGDDVTLRSPWYSGKVMKYTIGLDNGNLKYTITGYAGLYSSKELKFSPKKEYLEGPNGDNKAYEEGSNGEKDIIPFKYIQNMFDTEFGPGSKNEGMYDLIFLDNCFVDDETGARGGTYVGEDIGQFQQKNFFEALGDILKGCLHVDEKAAIEQQNQFSPTQKQCYSYFVDSVMDDNQINNEETSTDSETDSSAKVGTVYIYKLPSINKVSNSSTSTNTDEDAQEELDKEKEEEGKAHLGIQFNWFAPSQVGVNFLVKSWEPDFDGSLAIALALKLQTTDRWDESCRFETMDKDGNVQTIWGLGATRLSIKDPSRKMTYNSIQEYAQWSFVTQYPYKATLVVQGCPCEVPLTGKIKVQAMMGNQEHDSSGVYYILGKKDTLNNSGYFTEFELFKLVPTFNPDFVKDESQTNTSNSSSNSSGSNTTTATAVQAPTLSEIKQNAGNYTHTKVEVINGVATVIFLDDNDNETYRIEESKFDQALTATNQAATDTESNITLKRGPKAPTFSSVEDNSIALEIDAEKQADETRQWIRDMHEKQKNNVTNKKSTVRKVFENEYSEINN